MPRTVGSPSAASAGAADAAFEPIDEEAGAGTGGAGTGGLARLAQRVRSQYSMAGSSATGGEDDDEETDVRVVREGDSPSLGLYHEARIQRLETENKRLAELLAGGGAGDAGRVVERLRQELASTRAYMSMQLSDAHAARRASEARVDALAAELKARSGGAAHAKTREAAVVVTSASHAAELARVRTFYQRKMAEAARKAEARVRAAARGDVKEAAVAVNAEMEALRAENEALRARVEEVEGGGEGSGIFGAGAASAARVAMELQALRKQSLVVQRQKNAIDQLEREVTRLAGENAELRSAAVRGNGGGGGPSLLAAATRERRRVNGAGGKLTPREEELAERLHLIEERLEARERRLTHVLTTRDRDVREAIEVERAKFMEIVDAKNADLVRFKRELDSIAEGFRALGLFRP